MTAQEPEAGEPQQYRGVIIIEWPPPAGATPYSAMNGSLLVITDALTGNPIRTCSRLTVRADASEIVTADLTLFMGEDGQPILDGIPVRGDDEILTGTFPFVVAEMRVRQE